MQRDLWRPFSARSGPVSPGAVFDLWARSPETGLGVWALGGQASGERREKGPLAGPGVGQGPVDQGREGESRHRWLAELAIFLFVAHGCDRQLGHGFLRSRQPLVRSIDEIGCNTQRHGFVARRCEAEIFVGRGASTSIRGVGTPRRRKLSRVALPCGSRRSAGRLGLRGRAASSARRVS
jgi:hypothetical protein